MKTLFKKLYLKSGFYGRNALLIILLYILGASAAYYFSIQINYLLYAGILAIIISLLFMLHRQFYGWFSLGAASLIIGMLSISLSLSNQAAFPLQDGQKVQLSGQVMPEMRPIAADDSHLLVKTNSINGHPWQGLLYLYYQPGSYIAPGTYIEAEGEVFKMQGHNNPHSFDYSDYLLKQGIAASISCYEPGFILALNASNQAPQNTLSRLLTAFEQVAEENAPLLRGVFFGDKSELDYALHSNLSLAGVLHSFAVSGLHVGFIVMAALFIVGKSRSKRWWRLAISMAFLLFYLSLTGLSASILRAAIMAILMLSAQALEQKSDNYTNMAIAALVCLLYRPLWIFDAGFQLSFCAVWGIFYLYPHSKWLLSGEKESLFSKIFALTITASIATMPLIAYYFYHISWVALLISPLFVLGVGIVVIFCFLAALGAIFSLNLAAIPLYIADLVMTVMANLANWSANLPFAYTISGQISPALIIICYLIILALPLCRQLNKPKTAFATGLLAICLILSVIPGYLNHNDNLKVTYIDVGQGDATLIITPNQQKILLDGGGNAGSPGSIGQYTLLPYLKAQGIDHLDMIISTHPDFDHIDGLISVAKYIDVDTLLYAETFDDIPLQQELLTIAEQNNIKLQAVISGDYLQLDENISIEVLNPQPKQELSDNNAASIAILLSYGRIDYLFTGDADFEYLSAIPHAEIVKLPHHGSGGAYDEQAYRQLAAEMVIISCGKDNSYGHPGQNVLEYWQGLAQIYRTDTDGAITIESDGQDFWASTYLDSDD